MLIKNGIVFIDGKFNHLDILIENGKIVEISPTIQGDANIDATNKIIFPGFIDLHIHGANFVNCWDGEEAVRTISKALPQYGVTGYYPTLRANDVDKSVAGIRGIRKAKDGEGAKILGVHLYTGYRNRSIAYYNIRQKPSIEHTLALCDNDMSDIKIALCAPELEGGSEWIKWISKQGIVAEIGFSEGTATQMQEAADYGATLTDHFFNGFPLMDHHEDGSTIGCLLEDRLYITLNCDCIHVAKSFIQLAIRTKGINKIIAVSDSSTFVGAKEGTYVRDDNKVVIVKDGAVRDENGKLVTGAHSYDENMRTMLAHGFTLEEIGTIFSENAAKVMKLNDRGKIEVGRVGDLVIMDQQLNINQTIMDGFVVFKK